jgi:transcriptional regulator GlxA family with amidase domain
MAKASAKAPTRAKAPATRRRRVWLLVVPGAELLDVAGPWEVFAHASEVLGREAYDLRLFGPEAGAVRTRHSLALGSVEALPRSPTHWPDLAIVAGGSPREPVLQPEQQVAAWLARHHPRIPAVVSICTGAFILGHAGLLDGRQVTTHWRFLRELGERFPRARVVNEGIFVQDGKIWTSAGITAGIDLALALVEAHHGHAVAMAVARNLVVFLRRPGSQAQFSATLIRQEQAPGKLGELSAYVLEHLQEPLPVERLARALGMSARTLTRFCRERWQEAPAALVRQVRIDEARRLLEETSLPLKDIAVRTGLGNASTLWRAFAQHLGVTPAQYRTRFSTATGTAT